MNKEMNLRDLLVIKMNALYDMEQELVDALPKMIEAASDEELKALFTSHLEETENHVSRLSQAHELLGEKPTPLKGDGIRGLIKDGQWVIHHTKPAEALDAHLIRVAQYIEHYEMAGYLGAIAWADMLGELELVSVFEATFEEEMGSDQKLDELAERLDKRIA